MLRSRICFCTALCLLSIGCHRPVAKVDPDEWIQKARAQWTGPIDINQDGTMEQLTIAVIEPQYVPYPLDGRPKLILVTKAEITWPERSDRLCFHDLAGDPGRPNRDWVQDANKDGTYELVYSIDGKRIVDSGGYCLRRDF